MDSEDDGQGRAGFESPASVSTTVSTVEIFGEPIPV
jgi:hypothetical protein